MLPSAPGRGRDGLRQRAELSQEPLERDVAAVARFNVYDDVPLVEHAADIHVRVLQPERCNLLGVRRRATLPFGLDRVFPTVPLRAVRPACARADSVLAD